MQAAVELQKRADAAIKNLEAERAQLQSTRINLERQAVQAIHDAAEAEHRHWTADRAAFVVPLQEMKQSASYVCQHLKEVSWLTISLMVAAGLLVGLMLGYWLCPAMMLDVDGVICIDARVTTVWGGVGFELPHPAASRLTSTLEAIKEVLQTLDSRILRMRRKIRHTIHSLGTPTRPTKQVSHQRECCLKMNIRG